VKPASHPIPAALLAAALSCGTSHAQNTEDRLAALEQRVAAIEARLGTASEAPQATDAAAAVEKNKLAARDRARRDSETYSEEERREIESLYQVANKNWRSPEAVDSLEKLIANYDKANRTGCAVLYLGQMSEGEKRLEYLRKAVADFSDCYYFNGCQVGGYARLVLADTLAKAGKKDEAMQLIEELRADYPTATDHGGRLIGDVITKIDWAGE
jgi:TolA-binding protein